MIYPGAIWRPGANAGYRAGRTTMQLAVCHTTVGRDSTAIGDRGYFNFLVRRNGEIVQFAEADATTFHAGTANGYGPGIEVEYLDEPEGVFTPEAYQATAGLVEWLIGLGIPDAFYDGPRVDPGTYAGFLTHRSVQQPDGHSDWWPELPRTTTPPEDDDVKPVLLRPKPNGKTWVYDPANHTKTWVRTSEALNALIYIYGVQVDANDGWASIIEDARDVDDFDNAGGGAAGPLTVTLTGTATP